MPSATAEVVSAVATAVVNKSANALGPDLESKVREAFEGVVLDPQVVTYGLVGIVVTSGGILFAAVSWLNRTFQTREAARAQMEQITQRFETMDEKIDGLHDHLRHMTKESNDKLDDLRDQIKHNVRTTSDMAVAVGYMKGKFEKM